jgi:hypothetical protein
MPRFSVWTQTVLSKVTSLASDDAFALATNTPEAKAIERDDLIADIAPDVLDELPLTTDGDLLTQAAGARARITRADLAADTAFTGAFAGFNPTGWQHIQTISHFSTSASQTFSEGSDDWSVYRAFRLRGIGVFGFNTTNRDSTFRTAIRINGDTGSNYAYLNDTVRRANSSTATATRDQADGATFALVSIQSRGDGTDGLTNFEAVIQQQGAAGLVVVRCYAASVTTNDIGRSESTARYSASATITSITIGASTAGNFPFGQYRGTWILEGAL